MALSADLLIVEDEAPPNNLYKEILVKGELGLDACRMLKFKDGKELPPWFHYEGEAPKFMLIGDLLIFTSTALQHPVLGLGNDAKSVQYYTHFCTYDKVSLFFLLLLWRY